MTPLEWHEALRALRIEKLERGWSDEQFLDFANERGLLASEPCPKGCPIDPDGECPDENDPAACELCGGFGMAFVCPDDNEDPKES